MTDKRRAGSIAGDVERASQGARTKTNPRFAIPEVEIDPEMTPPPAPPPEFIASLSIEEQVEVLRAGAQEHAAAIARVWEARNLHENVVTLGKDVTELVALTRDFMMPAVKTLLGRVDVIERANVANSTRQDRFWSHEWPTALKTLENIGQHMGRIEKDVDRLERNVDEYIKRSDEQFAHARASMIELRADWEKRETQLKADIAQKETRIRALEDFVLTLKAKVAIVSALVGSGGAGVALLLKSVFGG
jgi:hypothetical protein